MRGGEYKTIFLTVLKQYTSIICCHGSSGLVFFLCVWLPLVGVLKGSRSFFSAIQCGYKKAASKSVQKPFRLLVDMVLLALSQTFADCHDEHQTNKCADLIVYHT